MELDLGFLLEKQRERKASVTGRSLPSLLLHMTPGEKRGLPALHRQQQSQGQPKISTHLNTGTKKGTTKTIKGLSELFKAHHKSPALVSSASFLLCKTPN